MTGSLIDIADRVMELILGDRETDRADPRARAGKAPFAPVAADGLFVDVVRLPAGTLREARDAVALQLDRLSPFEDSAAEWDLLELEKASTVGGRNRFLLAVAPHATLAAARAAARHSSAIEGFVADVEADGERRRAVFYDQAAATRRRKRRLWLTVTAAAVLGALSFLSQEVDAAAARQATRWSSRQQILSGHLAQARQREATAHALAAAAQTARDHDALAEIAENIAGLSDPSPKGLAIETLTVSRDAVRLVGFTDDAKAIERDLRTRTSLRVESFTEAPGADPFGRGARIEATMTPVHSTDPS
ncbi:MAG: hypothetical protein IV086_10875 [Hyphomonadaceae bacterium]|nr:hypothetical protein [Hyphomonadaceae bacterium]